MSLARCFPGGALWLARSCTGLLALTWIACSSEPRPPQSPAPSGRTEEVRGEPCTQDGDCASQFCDRGACAEPGTKGNYGAPCEPPAPIVRPPPPRPDMPATWYRSSWPENKCGGYVCIDKRCRSCQAETECTWGGPICDKFDDWPGKQCGRHVDPDPEGPLAPPPTEPAPYPRAP
jgi:hypothetical protein